MTHRSQPIEGFEHLTDTISLSLPQPTSNGTDSTRRDATQTIVICAWFRAQRKHIAKYTNHYRQRDPSAQILLLECVYQDMLSTSYATQQSRLQPAVDIFQAAQKAGQSIFLHSFSNGGGNTAVQLASAWRRTTKTPLPISATALDSSPGSASIVLAAAAVILSVPKSARWWAAIFAWTIVVPGIFLASLFGSGNVVDKLRKELVDQELFPLEAPRVYLYSKVDEMVPYEAVEEHMAFAKQAGYGVEGVVFEKSPHVAHINEDKQKYWKAIEAIMSRDAK